MCRQNKGRKEIKLERCFDGCQLIQDLQGFDFYSKSNGSPGKVLCKEVTHLIYISETLILAAEWMDNRGTRMEAESSFRTLLLYSRCEIWQQR